jgi:hypothetical protein
MPTNGWEELYLQTVVEVDRQKIQESINATRQAIAERLKESGQNSADDSERQRIEKALKALDTLEGEIKNW